MKWVDLQNLQNGIPHVSRSDTCYYEFYGKRYIDTSLFMTIFVNPTDFRSNPILDRKPTFYPNVHVNRFFFQQKMFRNWCQCAVCCSLLPSYRFLWSYCWFFLVHYTYVLYVQRRTVYKTRINRKTVLNVDCNWTRPIPYVYTLRFDKPYMVVEIFKLSCIRTVVYLAR